MAVTCYIQTNESVTSQSEVNRIFIKKIRVLNTKVLIKFILIFVDYVRLFINLCNKR